MNVSATYRCPKCNNDQTKKLSQTLTQAGFLCIIIGLFTVAFLIGLPILAVGVYLTIKGMMTKDNVMHCKRCGTEYRVIFDGTVGE